MKNNNPEQQIKNSILAWLKVNHIFSWPVDSVGIFDPVKKIYRLKQSQFHIKGVSDILGIYNGKPLAIEVKSKTGRLSKEQHDFLTAFQQDGGIAIVARSIDDVKLGIQEHCMGILIKRGFA